MLECLMQVGVEGRTREAFGDANPRVAMSVAPADWGAGSANMAAAATLAVQMDPTAATPGAIAGESGTTSAEVSCVARCEANRCSGQSGKIHIPYRLAARIRRQCQEDKAIHS